MKPIVLTMLTHYTQPQPTLRVIVCDPHPGMRTRHAELPQAVTISVAACHRIQVAIMAAHLTACDASCRHYQS